MSSFNQSSFDLDFLPAAVSILDREQLRIIVANQRFCALLGFTERELDGVSWSSVLTSESAAIAENAFRSGNEPEATLEWHFRRQDGSILSIHGRYRLIKAFDNSQNVRELVMIAILGDQQASDEMYPIATND
jgi:PAS domain S-box-containing protein